MRWNSGFGIMPTEFASRFDIAKNAAIDAMWHRALLRAPVEAERAVLHSLYETERTRYDAAPADASAIAGDGDQAIRRAALVSVASAILNTDEFLSRP